MSWLVKWNGQELDTDDLTITELIAHYLQHCETYYVDSQGRNTKEFSGNKEAVAPLLALFGEDLARDFGEPAHRPREADVQMGQQE